MKAKDMVDEMRPNYEFDYSKGVRGKYFWRLIKEEGRGIAVLDPDVAKAFPNSDAVNKALRAVMHASTGRTRKAPRTRKKA